MDTCKNEKTKLNIETAIETTLWGYSSLWNGNRSTTSPLFRHISQLCPALSFFIYITWWSPRISSTTNDDFTIYENTYSTDFELLFLHLSVLPFCFSIFLSIQLVSLKPTHTTGILSCDFVQWIIDSVRAFKLLPHTYLKFQFDIEKGKWIFSRNWVFPTTSSYNYGQ